MKPVLAVLIAVWMAGSASADMIAPWHRSLSVTTVITSDEPLPGYEFYVVHKLGEDIPDRIVVEPGKRTVVSLEPTRGTTLVAVPISLSNGGNVAVDVARRGKPCPPGVRAIPIDTYLHVHQFDHRDEPERHVVVRKGSDGVEFEVIRRAGSSGSREVIAGGLALTALAILIGFRRARRRRKPV